MSFSRQYLTRGLYAYGYQFNQVAAVKYLVSRYPKWAATYELWENHDKAMDEIADELSQGSGLTLHAIPIWVGSGYTGYSVVFPDGTMLPEKRTLKDAEGLMKLEERLKSMGIAEPGGPKFEKVCSMASRRYFDEPRRMVKKQPPPGWKERDDEYTSLVLELEKLRKKYRKGACP